VTIFEQTLRDILVASNLTSNRVFLIRAPQVPAPQAVTPYMVFFGLGPNPHYGHDGPLETLDREYQISLFDLSQSTALAMAETLRDYLEHTRGDYQQVRLSAFFHRAQTQQYETDTKLFQIVQEWRILYALLDTTRSSFAVPTRSNTRSKGVRS